MCSHIIPFLNAGRRQVHYTPFLSTDWARGKCKYPLWTIKHCKKKLETHKSKNTNQKQMPWHNLLFMSDSIHLGEQWAIWSDTAQIPSSCLVRVLSSRGAFCPPLLNTGMEVKYRAKYTLEKPRQLLGQHWYQGSPTCPYTDIRVRGETYQYPWQKLQSMVKLLNINFGCPWQKSDFGKMSTTSLISVRTNLDLYFYWA